MKSYLSLRILELIPTEKILIFYGKQRKDLAFLSSAVLSFKEVFVRDLLPEATFAILIFVLMFKINF